MSVFGTTDNWDRSGGALKGESFVVAKRSAEITIGGIRHSIKAGVTYWAANCPELRWPEIAALFGVKPTGALAAARSRDWLPPSSPTGRDWLAASAPEVIDMSERVSRPAAGMRAMRVREERACSTG
jgi:hypothetical protein